LENGRIWLQVVDVQALVMILIKNGDDAINADVRRRDKAYFFSSVLTIHRQMTAGLSTTDFTDFTDKDRSLLQPSQPVPFVPFGVKSTRLRRSCGGEDRGQGNAIGPGTAETPAPALPDPARPMQHGHAHYGNVSCQPVLST
jgi:hypothetical protein